MQSSMLGGDRMQPVSGSHRSLAVIAVLAGALALSGCLASQTASMQLSMQESSGDLTIRLTLEDGKLTQTRAWWSQDAPQAAIGPQERVEAWDAVVLKNDVVLDHEPLYGSQEDAVFAWSIREVGAVASPGDSFEVLIVNATEGGTIASYGLEITA